MSNFKDKFIPKKCFHSHPRLPIEIGDDVYKVSGGSCIEWYHQREKAEITVGFDYGMSFTKKNYPWEPGQEIFYLIKDMTAPDDKTSFKKLVDWCAKQIIDGKRLHMGCIGGHGRTGLTMAALVNIMTGEKDAIQYVRDFYCKKAVESQSQIDFLNTVFGIKKAKPTKTYALQGGLDFEKGGVIASGGLASKTPYNSGKKSGKQWVVPISGKNSVYYCGDLD